ncbi:MAG: hypothetical protein ABIY55_00280, partial [Kofleriaceae bacterium]
MQRGLVGLLVIAAATRAAAAEPDEGAGAGAATPADDADRSPDAAAPDPAPALAPAASPPATDPRRSSLGAVFHGPFRSSRLFAMPVADVVGAYVLSLSGEGSLLQQPGLLTAAGVVAIGFGDIAQLEYRHTEAIGVTGLDAPVPAIGVQLKLPIPERSGIPAIGVAFRLGVPRSELVAGQVVDETVTDLYLVGRLRFAQLPWLTLHGGTRISSAKAAPANGDPAEQRTLWLPTAGYEVQMNPAAKIVGEIALAPQFRWTPGSELEPTIGYGLLGRLGMRWAIIPSVIIDGSIGYQLEVANAAPATGPDA